MEDEIIEGDEEEEEEEDEKDKGKKGDEEEEDEEKNNSAIIQKKKWREKALANEKELNDLKKEIAEKLKKDDPEAKKEKEAKDWFNRTLREALAEIKKEEEAKSQEQEVKTQEEIDEILEENKDVSKKDLKLAMKELELSPKQALKAIKKGFKVSTVKKPNAPIPTVGGEKVTKAENEKTKPKTMSDVAKMIKERIRKGEYE